MIIKSIKQKIDLELCKKFSQLYTVVIRTLHDQNNNLVFSKTQLGKSYVGNFLQGIYAHYANTDPSFAPSCPPWNYNNMIINTSGGLYNVANAVFLKTNAAAADLTKGILLSTNDLDPTTIDLTIPDLITHGIGAGQLQYQSMSSPGMQVSPVKSTLDLSRTFINSSGSDVIVKKVYLTTYTNNTNLMYTDKLTPTFDSIPHGFVYGITIRTEIKI